jgi:hypothetical protein
LFVAALNAAMPGLKNRNGPDFRWLRYLPLFHSPHIRFMTTQGRLVFLHLALAMWLIARPFQGIWHDGKFYALQALHHLKPAAFSSDLFFLYGSQDQYSLFSVLYATAISLGGLNQGTMVLQAIGLGLWFAAAWALTRIFPEKLAVFALLLIASVGGHYGSHGVFSYGESFLTARLYAEIFSLAGLAAWLAGRKTMGGLAFAVAGVVHPLMALPALIIGLGLLLPPRTWLGLIAAGGAVALVLGALGQAPFTGLLWPMDALWFELGVARSPFVFLHTWEWEGFSRALFVLTVTGAAWRNFRDGKLRRLAWVTFACVFGAFVVAYVGGSLLKLPLVAGLQLTRVMWIGLVIALIHIAALLGASRDGDVWDRVLAWGLLLGVFLDSGVQGAYAVLVLAICWLGKRQLPHYRPSMWVWFLVAMIPLQILVWGALQLSAEGEQEALLAERSHAWRLYFSAPATSLIIVTSAYWLLGRDHLSKPLKWAGGVVAAATLALALLTWYDVGPNMDYGSTARRAAIAPIVASIPETATVYWVEEPVKTWFWLQRANYLSFSQTAGSVFSRGTAIEALRRARYVSACSLRDANQSWDERLTPDPAGYTSLAAIRQACRDPLLDYVIARSRAGSGLVYFLDPATGLGYGLYGCRAVGAQPSTVSGSNAVDA